MRTFKIFPLVTFKYLIKYWNYSHHTVHYISRTYLSYNWKFEPFYLFIYFCESYSPAAVGKLPMMVASLVAEHQL